MAPDTSLSNCLRSGGAREARAPCPGTQPAQGGAGRGAGAWAPRPGPLLCTRLIPGPTDFLLLSGPGLGSCPSCGFGLRPLRNPSAFPSGFPESRCLAPTFPPQGHGVQSHCPPLPPSASSRCHMLVWPQLHSFSLLRCLLGAAPWAVQTG